MHVSTPAVYRAWDELGGPTADGPNDLEPAALVVEPALRAWRERIGELAGVEPVLAGSGATWFVPGQPRRRTGAAARRGRRRRRRPHRPGLMGGPGQPGATTPSRGEGVGVGAGPHPA